MSTITAPAASWLDGCTPRRDRTPTIVATAHVGGGGRVAALTARLVAVAVVLLGVLAGVSAALATTSLADEPVTPPRTVVVQPGDTVWDLAAAHAPAGVSMQEYVMVIVTHNGVRATALRPGTVLELPR